MEYTQIIATISPKSGSRDILEKMVQNGMDVIRLNFAHCKEDECSQFISYTRDIAKTFDKKIPVIIDLPGPKIRIGKVPGASLRLEDGQEINFSTKDVSDYANHISIDYENLLDDVLISHRILLGDGPVELEVIGKDKDILHTVVKRGGEIHANVGASLPDSDINLPPITDKDRESVEFAVKENSEYIAMSFVSNANDIRELREIVNNSGSNAKIIAKIETKQAVENIEKIIDEADGIMVARGDLALAVGFEKVPGIQNKLVKLANDRGKSVIVATQMMQSMVHAQNPTRAEVSDIADAVLDGADAVMLSDETAMGNNPELAVLDMQKIIDEAEKDRPRKESIRL